MSAEKIITDWKKGQFKPVYWIEGEESFFIDQVMDYAEHHILKESEAGFNLTVFYGRDADWAQVINACRRYPMFSDRQVVLVKEAQNMKDIEKLEGYVEKPLPSTILVVGMKDKKVDGRLKFGKLIKAKAEMVTTKKMWDNELPKWVSALITQKGFSIEPQALQLLVDHVGNDLARLNNEIEKTVINLKDRKRITLEDIESYVGLSKEYNTLELQHALTVRNLSKCLQIIQYFEMNPKANPIQAVLPALYGFFSKAYLVFGSNTNDENELSKLMGYSPYSPYFKDLLNCAKNYRQRGVEQVLLLLHEYNLKSIGINNNGVKDASLMKEMIVKMIS